MERIELFGLPVDAVEHRDAAVAAIARSLRQKTPLTVSFVNPSAWQTARRQTDYAAMLRACDLVLPDGIGVVKALAWARGARAARVSFDASSLYLPAFAELAARGCRAMVVGGVPGVAEQAMARMQAEFPGVALAPARDGYHPIPELTARILAEQPDFVLCGMGAPYQERLLAALREAGYRGVAVTCGGFLDQLALKPRYYPAWIDRLELRWLYRIAMEPRRLLRRYAVDYLPFVLATATGALRGLRTARNGRRAPA